MSEWRRRAAENVPELWRDEDARESINRFFFELVRFVREAHRAGDHDALRRGYGFALWCFQQGGDLQNAAAVAFYEHLFDSWDVHAGVIERLDTQVARDCWALFEARLDADKLAVVHAGLRL